LKELEALINKKNWDKIFIVCILKVYNK
jgi:hypothetical protein